MLARLQSWRLAALLVAFSAMNLTAADDLRWTQLPALPDREGFAAMYAGAHNGVLLAAGGANFPGRRPWEGGAKVWYDTVYALDRPEGAWKVAGKLPRPLGYGVSVATSAGLVCVGGSDAVGHHTNVFRLAWTPAGLQSTALPPLPRPCANLCGTAVGSVLYVAGGSESPVSTTALRTFWSLDLRALEQGWRELEPWPGPGRMLATAAAHGGSFYVLGGAGLKADAGGRPEREWLRDAYRFTPGQGWVRIADLPRVAVAAPTPAPVRDGRWLLVLGGDDGAQVAASPAEHKGFPRDILAYDVVKDQWTRSGTVPFSKVTVPVAEWNGRWVVISGEQRPGIRSPEVWSLSP